MQASVLFKTPDTKRTGNVLPFVIHYDENTVKINNILKRHWNLLEQDEKLKKIWPEKPFLALQRHQNLADLLVHTALRPQHTPGS